MTPTPAKMRQEAERLTIPIRFKRLREYRLLVTDLFGIVLLAELASHGFWDSHRIGVVICCRIATLRSYGCDADRNFLVFKGKRIFHRTGIVSDLWPGGFPHWHRKTGFSAFGKILASLAS
jgi:hypothetical protein